MSKKTLYFEGAGASYTKYNDVENCRIRTAFTNKDGQKVYIELLSGHKYTKEKPVREFHYLYCDHCHYITDDPEIDDCNNSRLGCERNTYLAQIEWTKANILKFVNENCNADFEKVVILDSLAGYRVFKDKGKHNTSERYNFGDEFNYDEELTKKRIAKVAELTEHFKQLFNQQYDNTSYYIRDGKLTVCINVEEKKRIAAGYNERKFTVEV